MIHRNFAEHFTRNIYSEGNPTACVYVFIVRRNCTLKNNLGKRYDVKSLFRPSLKFKSRISRYFIRILSPRACIFKLIIKSRKVNARARFHSSGKLSRVSYALRINCGETRTGHKIVYTVFVRKFLN